MLFSTNHDHRNRGLPGSGDHRPIRHGARSRDHHPLGRSRGRRSCGPGAAGRIRAVNQIGRQTPVVHGGHVFADHIRADRHGDPAYRVAGRTRVGRQTPAVHGGHAVAVHSRADCRRGGLSCRVAAGRRNHAGRPSCRGAHYGRRTLADRGAADRRSQNRGLGHRYVDYASQRPHGPADANHGHDPGLGCHELAPVAGWADRDLLPANSLRSCDFATGSRR